MLIVHLICSFTTGGAETMLVDIANEQVSDGHQVVLFIINDLLDERLLSSLDKKIHIVKIGRRPGSRNVGSIFRLNRMLFRYKGAVLHCHDSVIAGMLLPIFDKSLYLTIHTIGVSGRFLNRYSKIFSISDSVQKELAQRVGFESIIIHNGVVVNRVRQKQRLQLTNLFRIVVVSRLDHLVKGQHVLLEALALIKKQGILFHVDFIGDGVSREYLQSLVKEYRLECSVSFLGLKSREYIYETLAEYDLFIQPSIIEGFGLTVIEAMLARIPVLVSGDGPVEIIKEGQYGFAFEKGNAKACAEKINDIYSSYSQLESLTSQAFRYARENFSISSTTMKYIENY
ncbi:MAG: glycosyltransferase [Tannerellaceae bacterium]|nr:glycosyltransferase [Tannerellaceae bacterium]